MAFKGWVSLIGLGAGLALSGCGASTPDPLAPKDFYDNTPRRVASETPLSNPDQPGQLLPKEPHADPPQTPEAADGLSEGIAPSVQTVVRPPGSDLAATQPTTEASGGATTQRTTLPVAEALATTQPTTAPSTMASTEMSPAEYMMLGSLVAEVNAKPIYANKILRLDASVLREDARQYDLERFEIVARQLIEQTVNELVHDELEYAAADKTLSTQDKQLAQQLTQHYRDTLISESGGSVQLARRKAEATGKSFEEQIEDQHRLYMVQLYYTRKVNPNVQVSRTDMWRYYNDHLNTDFSTQDQATIEIVQGEEAELESDRQQVLAGSANFSELPSTLSVRKLPGLQRGSFALKKVDAAIWQLQVGDISQPIKDRGGYYLIKVDSRIAGNVQSFESEELQAKIKSALEREQMLKLRDAEQRKLMEDAIITTNDQMIDDCVEMAMENYVLWRNPK